MKGASLLLLIAGVAFPLVVGYHVDPVSANLSGWTHRGDTVSQVVTINFDSLGYVELFAGEYGQGGAYNVVVQTYPGGQPVAQQDSGTYLRPQHWVKFDRITVTHPERVVKGTLLEFRFTRGGSDSIQYYYQDSAGGGPYRYGELVVGGTPQANLDLACRVYGRMNAVPGGNFGLSLPAFPYWWDSSSKDSWAARLAESRAGWATVAFEWNTIEALPGQYDFAVTDSLVSHVDSGIEPVAILVNCPRWASTAMETVMVFDSVEERMVKRETVSVHCPPINLWPANSESVNYFARWVDTLVGRYGDRIQTFICWNEPNDTCTRYIEGVTGWWRRPQWHYVPLSSGPASLCSLYMRLCWVADSVVKVANNRPTDRVLVGAMHRVHESSEYLVAGAVWLDMCYGASESVFWDGVAVHPYQRDWDVHRVFEPDSFELDAAALRAIMAAHNDFGELWNTELGYEKTADTVASRQRAARNLCEVLVTSEGTEARPEGGFDRSGWYLFWEDNPRWGHEPLVCSAFARYPCFHSFKQACSTLTGKRFNCRVMTGDTTEDAVRIYEFETADTLQRKTWVAWRNQFEGDGIDPRTPAAIPTRCDANDSFALAYDNSPPSGSKTAGTDGWARTLLGVRPVFFSEADPPSRPDLVVDSLTASPDVPQVHSWMELRAYVKNIGNSTTPESARVRFYCNDSQFASCWIPSGIDSGETVQAVLVFYDVPKWMRGLSLFRAAANPEQAMVEKAGLDDNTGYKRVRVAWQPYGTVDVVMPPGGRTNVPVVVFRLSSASLEKDSTGNTPCDSARLIQEYFGTSDTTVQDADTTEWFGFVPDTSWRFMFGQGRCRYYLQVKDSWSESGLIADTVDSVVVFDTSAAVGSVLVNSGARFAPDTLCTLDISVADSVSGVYRMRFGNHRLANLECRRSGDADKHTSALV